MRKSCKSGALALSSSDITSAEFGSQDGGLQRQLLTSVGLFFCLSLDGVGGQSERFSLIADPVDFNGIA